MNHSFSSSSSSEKKVPNLQERQCGGLILGAFKNAEELFELSADVSSLLNTCFNDSLIRPCCMERRENLGDLLK